MAKKRKIKSGKKHTIPMNSKIHSKRVQEKKLLHNKIETDQLDKKKFTIKEIHLQIKKSICFIKKHITYNVIALLLAIIGGVIAYLSLKVDIDSDNKMYNKSLYLTLDNVILSKNVNVIILLDSSEIMYEQIKYDSIKNDFIRNITFYNPSRKKIPFNIGIINKTDVEVRDVTLDMIIPEIEKGAFFKKQNLDKTTLEYRKGYNDLNKTYCKSIQFKFLTLYAHKGWNINEPVIHNENIFKKNCTIGKDRFKIDIICFGSGIKKPLTCNITYLFKYHKDLNSFLDNLKKSTEKEVFIDMLKNQTIILKENREFRDTKEGDNGTLTTYNPSIIRLIKKRKIGIFDTEGKEIMQYEL